MLPATGARLLDLTRLVSRLGRGPLTGIDRVEFAYLNHLVNGDRPLFGLVRTGLGFILLDRAGCGRLALLVSGQADLPLPDIIGRILYRQNPVRGQAESAVRRLAIGRSGRLFMKRLLRKLPDGSTYLNVGHANLSPRCLHQINRAGLRIAVLVHDTIPLDHPEFARTGTAEPFRRKMLAVARFADVVIHTTNDARAKTQYHLAQMGRVPAGLVANLGVPLPEPNIESLPPGLNLTPPYFVTLGTIEPRKNHVLLLDIWDRFGTGPDVPRLFVIGNRGWASPELFARLDALPAGHPVQVLSGLPDAAVTAILTGATALLFPSLAEGFGLPAVEAAALGVPVITSDLAVIKELLGDYAVYLDGNDIYSWIETLKTHTNAVQQGSKQKSAVKLRIKMPQWSDHFKIVLRDL